MYAELFILRLSENCKNAAGNSYIYTKWLNQCITEIESFMIEAIFKISVAIHNVGFTCYYKNAYDLMLILFINFYDTQYLIMSWYFLK